MATRITQQNMEALRPLYKPSAQPDQHRVKGAAAPVHGRRPSNCDLVRSVRLRVDDWRSSGYLGACDTSKRLLNHWFANDHLVAGLEGPVPFAYNWAQREAIETLIYLYEVDSRRNLADLLLEYGGEQFLTVAAGLDPRENAWARYCFKIATGAGKTKAMSLAIAWSYFCGAKEPATGLPKHFLIIAPGITVYERLKDDFNNLKVFRDDPVLPDEWRDEFLNNVQVVLQDSPGGETAQSVIYLSNIHRLYANKDEPADDTETSSIFGPPVQRAKVYDGGASLRKRIAAHGSIMVLNDEAHHLHDPDLAWNTAIETLNGQMQQVGNPGVVAQLDFTATPKHNDGTLFRHIVCDFPLGEAVDAGIVKVPVIGESGAIPSEPDPNLPAAERYRVHLQVGYERWRACLEALQGIRTPILFVMTEDTAAANEIYDYLNSEQFPELTGRVLNVHTNLKVKEKQYLRAGKRVKEWVERDLNDKEMIEVRRMSRELDKPHSKYRCVVSVLMLREGWDVKNVTTIVPLRAYSAASNILPEQTLGRGLRRMFPGSDTPECVTVVHHPAFEALYDEAMAQEGFEMLVSDQPIRDTVVIYVDHANKPVSDLEIAIPRHTDSVQEALDLAGLTFEEIRTSWVAGFNPVQIGVADSGPTSYIERQLVSRQVVSEMEIDLGLLDKAWSAVDYYTKKLERSCHVAGQGPALRPLVIRFVQEVLFGAKVSLYDGTIDHRMRDVDVAEHIGAVFEPLIKTHTRHSRQRRPQGGDTLVSAWKPFTASITEKRPALKAARCMFNLTPCDNDVERRFVEFCDRAEDITAFIKNTGPQKLAIDYMKAAGDKGYYWPDFIVRTREGITYLVETKGQEDKEVPRKAAAGVEWCAATPRSTWRYMYLPQHLFDAHAATRTIALLHAGCEPALKSLLDQLKTYQAELPLERIETDTREAAIYLKLLDRAGLTAVHESLAPYIAQAAVTLQNDIDADHPRLTPAFTALLGQLDAVCAGILQPRLAGHMPQESHARRSWFDCIGYGYREKDLANYGKSLQGMLDYGAPRFKLATLIFCIEVANEWQQVPAGVWQAVRAELFGPQFAELLGDLRNLNAFRNKYVAHEDDELADVEVARAALANWTRCLAKLSDLASVKAP